MPRRGEKASSEGVLPSRAITSWSSDSVPGTVLFPFHAVGSAAGNFINWMLYRPVCHLGMGWEEPQCRFWMTEQEDVMSILFSDGIQEIGQVPELYGQNAERESTHSTGLHIRGDMYVISSVTSEVTLRPFGCF